MDALTVGTGTVILYGNPEALLEAGCVRQPVHWDGNESSSLKSRPPKYKCMLIQGVSSYYK